jgi:hypothetical protein
VDQFEADKDSKWIVIIAGLKKSKTFKGASIKAKDAKISAARDGGCGAEREEKS